MKNFGKGSSREPAGKDRTRQLARQDVYTTGEVARINHTATRTVAAWIDSGKLKGYRLPSSRGSSGRGSGSLSERRVTRAELLRFMRAHGIPVPPWLAGALLLCAAPESLAASVARSGREAWCPLDLFAAAARVAQAHPATACVGPLWGQETQASLVRHLSAEGTSVLALEAEDAAPGFLAEAGASAVMPVGSEASHVLARLLGLEEG